jgi:hypothetical protein
MSNPVKLPMHFAFLRHVTSNISPETNYLQNHLNLIIAKCHKDTAALRRYMIEYGILERNGESVYWATKQ